MKVLTVSPLVRALAADVGEFAVHPGFLDMTVAEVKAVHRELRHVVALVDAANARALRVEAA